MRGEIRQIFELINLEKIHEISREYFENDLSVQELVKYLRCEEFKTAWKVFESSSEVEDIFEWMKNHGVEASHEMQLMADEFENVTPLHIRSRRFHSFSIGNFKDELGEQIQFEEIDNVIDQLLANGNDFAHLYLILKVSRPALEKLFEERELKKAAFNLSRLGFDVSFMKQFAYNLLRWNWIFLFILIKTHKWPSHFNPTHCLFCCHSPRGKRFYFSIMFLKSFPYNQTFLSPNFPSAVSVGEKKFSKYFSFSAQLRKVNLAVLFNNFHSKGGSDRVG